MLHPALQGILDDPAMTVRVPPPPVSTARVREAANAAMHRGRRPALASVTEALVPAAPPMPVRVYRPRAGPNAPAVVLYHGVGFVWSSPDTHDGLCRRIAERSGAVVVSVNYRLSSGAPYPAAEDGALAVLGHLWKHAAALGIDRRRIGVCSDGAGAFVAACAAARFLAAGGSLTATTLIDPALDPRCVGPQPRGSRRRSRPHDRGDAPVLTRPPPRGRSARGGVGRRAFRGRRRPC